MITYLRKLNMVLSKEAKKGIVVLFFLSVFLSVIETKVGEGGVCLTDDEELCYRLALIRNHGEAVVGPAQYRNITNIAGFNYRLTELQAAIAKEQLKKLDTLNRKRLDLVEELNKGLDGVDFLITPNGRVGCDSTYYVFPLRFIESIAGVMREEFVRAVNAEGIMFYPGYVKPLYFQPLYQELQLFKNGYPFAAPENKECSMNYASGICPVAEKLHFKQMLLNEHIRYPHTIEDMKDIIRAIEKVVS